MVWGIRFRVSSFRKLQVAIICGNVRYVYMYIIHTSRDFRVMQLFVHTTG